MFVAQQPGNTAPALRHNLRQLRRESLRHPAQLRPAPRRPEFHHRDRSRSRGRLCPRRALRLGPTPIFWLKSRQI